MAAVLSRLRALTATVPDGPPVDLAELVSEDAIDTVELPRPAPGRHRTDRRVPS